MLVPDQSHREDAFYPQSKIAASQAGRLCCPKRPLSERSALHFQWESLGGSFTSAPAICSWGVGRLDVFGRGEDFALCHKWFSTVANGAIGKRRRTPNSPPAAVSWGEREN